jgi:hypothetical protein
MCLIAPIILLTALLWLLVALVDLRRENRRLTIMMRRYREHLEAVYHRHGIKAADAPPARVPPTPRLPDHPGSLAWLESAEDSDDPAQFDQQIDQMLTTTARWQQVQQREVA